MSSRSCWAACLARWKVLALGQESFAMRLGRQVLFGIRIMPWKRFIHRNGGDRETGEDWWCGVVVGGLPGCVALGGEELMRW